MRFSKFYSLLRTFCLLAVAPAGFFSLVDSVEAQILERQSAVDRLVETVSQESESLQRSEYLEFDGYITPVSVLGGRLSYRVNGWSVLRHGHREQVVISDNMQPLLVFGHESGATLNTSGQWVSVNGGRWGFMIDDKHRKNWTGQGVEARATERVKLDLIGYLGPLLFGNERQFSFDAVSGAWSGKFEPKQLLVRIRLRTPSDSLRFGTPISDVIILQAPTRRGQMDFIRRFVALPKVRPGFRYDSLTTKHSQQQVRSQLRNCLSGQPNLIYTRKS